MLLLFSCFQIYLARGQKKFVSRDEKETFKTAYIDKLTENLSMLRAKAGVTQGDVADRIGIARQTYSAIECGRSRMSWNTFMSLILFFKENPQTQEVIKILGIYTDELEKYIKVKD